MLDITELQSTFKGDLVTPENPEYVSAIARWASNAQRPAAIVAFVKDTSDIISALRFACTHNLDVAVRGGGHSPGGASSSDGGIVLDLSRYMNGVSVDADKKVAYVAGGAIWETVDRETMKYGLATVAGTVNHTGVAGLTLGGGWGWLSGELGLVIDNLLQATVVTASGSIVTANLDENPDLFFSIRGGGGNFGVVSQFVFKLSPQRQTVYAGEVVFPASRMEDIVERVNSWWKTVRGNEALFVGFTTDADGNPLIWTFLFYNGAETDGRTNFKWLLDLGPLIDATKEVAYHEVNGLMNHLFLPGMGTFFHAETFRHIDLQSAKIAHKKLCEVATLGKVGEPMLLYQFVPHGAVNAVPRDATAFRRDTISNTLDVLVSFRWDQRVKGDQTQYARSQVKEIGLILDVGERGLNTHEKLGYANHDADSSSSGREDHTPGSKAQLVFGSNYPKLQEVKKKYDPDNIFNKWFPITPAP